MGAFSHPQTQLKQRNTKREGRLQRRMPKPNDMKATAMEIQGSDGSTTLLNPHSTTLFGRGNGFNQNDPAVSRRHLSFHFIPSTHSPGTQTDPRVSFEVLGKNPVWVRPKNQDHPSNNINTFKRFQRGQLGVGDMFCLSPKHPLWFTLKQLPKPAEIVGRVNDELSQSLDVSNGDKDDADFGLDALDVSTIDPAPEFGFLVIGHEFDQYPRQMIRDVKNWDWFLEDPRGDSEEEEEDVAKKRVRGGRGGKRKKTKRDDDDANEEWTGESEDEEAITRGPTKVQRSTSYQTRSKDRGKANKKRNGSKSAAKTSANEEEEEIEDEEDEEDETLGGFIVMDDSVEEEEDEDDNEQEEEEEFVEDDEELED